MKLTREHGVMAIVAAVLIGGAVWVARHTEWADEKITEPPKPEVLRDPDHRLKQLLTRLGANVVAPENLDQLPPLAATLVLSSWNWNLFTEREPALRRWVEAGGTLVVPNFGFTRDGFDWVPVKARVDKKPAASAAIASSASQPAAPTKPHAEDDEEDEDADDEVAKPLPRKLGVQPLRCPGVNEPDGVAPAFGFARGYATCMYLGGALVASVLPLWALDGPRGHVIVRVPLGRGSVTACSVDLPTGYVDLLDHDNALIAAAALQVRPGREVWIVRGEARPPLLAFLWQRGAPAVGLLAAALAFALWRGARRFGPRIAALPLARRSMAEQIRGTAGFIAQRGSPALHTAQSRALQEAATPRIQGFDAMPIGERADAIAALTGLDATALAHAMNPALAATLNRHPPAALALIETARRRLLNGARNAAPGSEPR